MSLFSAYSAATGTSAALADATQDSNTVLIPKPTSIGLFLADVLQCSIPICPWPSLAFGAFIGSGTSMDVWRGTFDAKSVAIKRLRVNEIPQSLSSVDASNRRFALQLKSAALELLSMSLPALRRCPNVVKLLAVSWNEEGPEWQRLLQPALVVEAAAEEAPTLEQLMSSLKSRELGVKEELLNDVLEGLQAIHDSGIVHGDVKPENVLIFHEPSRPSGYIAKLSDFGFSQLDPDSELAAGGTPYWNAPECLDGCPAALSQFKTGSKRDVYSFGLLATYLISGQKPFSSDAAEDWPGKQSKVDKIKWEDGVSSHVRQFITHTVRLKPAIKPKFDLDNMNALGETVEELNSRLARGDHTFEVYNHETTAWEDAEGWLTIGFVCFLSFTVCRDPQDRPSIPELRKFWGFSRPEDYSKIHRPPTNTPLLGLKASASRAAGGNAPFPHERVPESMRAELFRHILSEAEDENCDAVLKAFVSDWYNIGFGIEKNPDKGYLWAVKAALAPCRTPAVKFGLTVEVMRMRKAGAGSLEEAVESEMLIECISYLNILADAGGKKEEEKANFVEMLGNSSVMSLETLRREFQHSSSFPRSTLLLTSLESSQKTLLESLESVESLTPSQSSALSELKPTDLFSLVLAAIRSQSFTALTHLTQFQPSLLRERDAIGFTLLQHAFEAADLFATGVLSRLGANTDLLLEPQFVREICAWGSEVMVSYIAQIRHRAAHLNVGVAYDLRAAFEDSHTLINTDAPIQPGSAVPALHGAIQTNNVRTVLALLVLDFGMPLDLEARIMGALTPLWMAVVMHTPLSAAALIAAGADVQAPVQGYGYALRPLHYLCAAGDEGNELVQLLDNFRATAEESSPLETSFGRLEGAQAETVRNELCSLLLLYGMANVNAPDSEGLTPLMWCCKRGLLSTARHLVRVSEEMAKMGAGEESEGSSKVVNFMYIDIHGQSAFDHAASAGHVDMSTWCLEMSPSLKEAVGAGRKPEESLE